MAKLLKPVEFAINQALKLDPETRARLDLFEGRSIVIQVEDFKQPIRAHISERAIVLSHNDDEDADLLINGKALALMKLGKNPDELFSAEITIHGNVQFAKQLRDWLEAFDFDWEKQIAAVIGDSLAYPLAQGLRKGLSWLNNSSQSLQQNMAEYLREEARLLPDKSQIDAYMNDIDRLRADCDRLEARVQRLHRD